jgi:hypothetical protein
MLGVNRADDLQQRKICWGKTAQLTFMVVVDLFVEIYARPTVANLP